MEVIFGHLEHHNTVRFTKVSGIEHIFVHFEQINFVRFTKASGIEVSLGH